MTPFEQARMVYTKEPCARSFDEDLFLHLENGWVVGTPDFFVMARPVFSWAPAGEVVNPAVKFYGRCDCWHIYLCAGDMAKALAFLPYKLPFVSVERKNKLRVWAAEKFFGRILKGTKS